MEYHIVQRDCRNEELLHHRRDPQDSLSSQRLLLTLQREAYVLCLAWVIHQCYPASSTGECFHDVAHKTCNSGSRRDRGPERGMMLLTSRTQSVLSQHRWRRIPGGHVSWLDNQIVATLGACQIICSTLQKPCTSKES